MNDAPARGPLFIHVGLTKCASTTLQEYFAFHPRVHFVDRRRTLERFVTRGCFDFDPAATADFLARSAVRDRVTVHSHERLAGSPHSGHYDAKEIADRIHSVAAGARLVLCIREQYDLIASCYKQFVRVGGALTFRQYVEARWQWRIPRFNPAAFEHHRLIAYYRRLFGPENVLVLLLEELAASPDRFFAALDRFLGIDAAAGFDRTLRRNAAETEEKIVERRVRNYLEARAPNIREPLPFDLDEPLAESIRRRLLARAAAEGGGYRDQAVRLLPGFYRASNRQTDTMLGGALRRYHYDL